MGLFDAIASSAANLTDNIVGMVNQNHQNKVNLRLLFLRLIRLILFWSYLMIALLLVVLRISPVLLLCLFLASLLFYVCI
jgi:hypothetical protein